MAEGPNLPLHLYSWLLLAWHDLAARPYEYAGMACGMGGAFFVSGHPRRAAIGWVLWIVSNGAWLVAGATTGAFPIIAQNLYFLWCNVRGLRRSREAAADIASKPA